MFCLMTLLMLIAMIMSLHTRVHSLSFAAFSVYAVMYQALMRDEHLVQAEKLLYLSIY